MEVVVSAITGDLVNRFISFLINRVSQQEHHLEKEEEKKKMVERLQHLLVRVHMVVEEAEGRYITNSMMLLQLKRLVEGMYRGYHVLSAVRSKSNTFSSSLRSNSINCFHSCTKSSTSSSSSTICGDQEDQLGSALDNLETMVSNMTEFVLLLGGCERMFRTPYDTHLYIDSFMFGRHVEKQQVMSILLQGNLPPDDLAPTVLPVTGASRVGKKTLVAHVCDNERVRSHFTSILHLMSVSSVESSSSATDDLHGHGDLQMRTLFVVEFTSGDDDDIDDETWQKFYSSATRIGGRGSKIIIITRSEKLSTRLGTVRPVRLDGLSLQEYSYLFKVLAFGSTNPEEHPRLASIADELAVLMGGSLITANVCADVFRNNQSVRLWLRVLSKYRNVVANNLSTFSEHPKLLMERNRRVDITKLVSSSSAAALHLMPPHSEEDESARGLQKVRFGDLIAGSTALPEEEFELVAWESRIPPYKRFVNVARFSDEVNKNISESTGQHRSQLSPSKKRQRTHP